MIMRHFIFPIKKVNYEGISSKIMKLILELYVRNFEILNFVFYVKVKKVLLFINNHY